jgi:hypothetical protein
MLSSVLYFIKPVTKVSVTRLSSLLYFIKPVTWRYIIDIM